MTSEKHMNVDFTLPELGENVASGDVVRVLVREGDVIAANDGVIELETDKAVVEIPCPYAGKVAKVHVTQGQAVKVGQPVLSVEAEAESPVKPRPVVAPPHPSPLPEGEGTKPVKPRPVVAPSHPSPLPTNLRSVPGEGTKSAKPQAAILPAGPEVRRVARELGVDLAQVRGTGKAGRITPEDVRAAVAATAATTSLAETPQPVVPPGELGQDVHGPVRRERMSKIRRTIAAQMVKSAGTIPHVTNFDDADVTELERLRKSIPQAYLGPAVKLTAMAFAIKAVALALRQHPLLNASLDEEKEEIVYKQYINLGVAVDTPRGLVVPVMRNVDQMGTAQLARELSLLAGRARAAEFTVDELRGGTFTISNLGAIGGAYSTPIINHPEVAVLLLGRSRWLLRLHEGKVENRLSMPLSLSFDHRVVDGAAAGRFLNDVIGYLQAPEKLLLTK
jgi:pyruvate dehydrogenase E2 component (dihydrolipoamide acetyltransferase)